MIQPQTKDVARTEAGRVRKSNLYKLYRTYSVMSLSVEEGLWWAWQRNAHGDSSTSFLLWCGH